MEKREQILSCYSKRDLLNNENNLGYSCQDAIKEFEELKQIALNCYDKNGNPNIIAAIRAAENKAKIANLYLNNTITPTQTVNMNEISIDGTQLKLNIGEEFL